MKMLDKYMRLKANIQKYKSSKGIIRIYRDCFILMEKYRFIQSIESKNKFTLEDLRNFAWMIYNEKENLQTNEFIPDDTIIDKMDDIFIIKYVNDLSKFIIELTKNMINITIECTPNIKDSKVNCLTKNIETNELPGNSKDGELIFDLVGEIIISSLDVALDMEIEGE